MPDAEHVAVPRTFLVNVRNALDAASVIGQRSCRPGDGLNLANHDRLIAEADALLDGSTDA